MAEVPTNVGQALAERLNPDIEKQARQDMRSNPSTEAVDQEIKYRTDQEAASIKQLSEAELGVCWKFKMSPSEYLKGKR